MNLILTERCNKGCSYCFADGNHEGKEDMSLENAKKIIDTLWETEKSIKLIGGEPTIAENFKEILNYIAWKSLTTGEKKKVTVITNMLFNSEIADLIIKYRKCDFNVSLLVNATELDVGHRLERFKENYKRFESEFKNLSSFMTPSITVSNDKSVSYLKKYTKMLIKEFPLFKVYRISLQFPSATKKYNPIGRYDIGNKIYNVTKVLKNKNRGFHFDCVIFPCLFLPYQYSFIKKYSMRSKVECKNQVAFDIFPDGRCIPCYSLSRLGIETHLDEEKLLNVRDELSRYKDDIHNIYLYKCIRCKFHKIEACSGPCKGFM